jgi:septal ring factor EnvC (AmiA/AmiB activator)
MASPSVLLLVHLSVSSLLSCLSCCCCCSSHTPSYRQSRDLTDQLQHLSSSSQQRSSQLQQLLEKLPQQLDRHLATAKQLHLLAFPPGQSCAPLVPAPAHHHGQIGSSAGGWDNASSAGAASAAPSIRSLRSASSSAASSGGHHNHPLPLLRVPEVAEAQQQLEACCQGLGRDMHRLVMKQNEYAVVMNQQRGELEVERSVMRLFFTQPQELAAHVERLKGEVEALELARELAVGQQ